MQRSNAFCIFIIILTGCRSDGVELFPVQTGARWRYQMRYQTMDGMASVPYVVTNLKTFQDETGQEIVVRASIDGRNFYYQYDEFGLKMLEWNRPDGLSSNVTLSGEYLFPYPYHVGDVWQGRTVSRTLIKTGPPQKTEFRITAEIPVQSMIESVDETVQLAAGRFNGCIKVHLHGSTFHNAGNYVGNTFVSVKEDRWYCPRVGLVKSIRYEQTTSSALDKGMLSLELQEFMP